MRFAPIPTVIAALLAWHSASVVDAHELGKTQVVVTIGADERYTVEMTVDPDALLTRLDLLAGDLPVRAADDADETRRIRARAETFLANVVIEFDSIRSMPGFEYRPPVDRASVAAGNARGEASDTGAGGVVTLRGSLPPSVHTLQFTSSLVFGSYALVVQRGEGGLRSTSWLVGGERSDPIALTGPAVPASTVEVVVEYLGLGFTHILPKGLDHILFVVGLFLASSGWIRLLAQISAFTVAHTVTLALTMMGAIEVPAAVVEPVIALSIVYVAVENLMARDVGAWRLVLVFGFGLMHGMGFAGVLREFGLPAREFVTALLSFNVGVEVGQITVVLLAWLAVAFWPVRGQHYQRVVVRPTSAAIALIGLYWTVTRLAG